MSPPTRARDQSTYQKIGTRTPTSQSRGKAQLISEGDSAGVARGWPRAAHPAPGEPSPRSRGCSGKSPALHLPFLLPQVSALTFCDLWKGPLTLPSRGRP